MVLVSYLNPLSQEGRDIVRGLGGLEEISSHNDDLMDIAIHTNRQTISNQEVVPETLVDLAVNRIKWYIERKNNKDFNPNDYAYFFNERIAEYDTIAFHILAQAIANKFRPGSREVKLFVESQGLMIEDRLTKLPLSDRKELVEEILSDLLIQDGIEWSFLKDLIATKKLSLTDLVLQNGEIVLDREEFVYSFGDEFTDRSPERVYDILIGDNLRELILTKLLMQNTENYIRSIQDQLAIVEMHPAIVELGELLDETITESLAKYSTYYASGGGFGNMEIGKLIREAFPPCIENTVNGVSSGGRNDAIVLLLTSFVSYARLYPGIFGSDRTVKVSDIDTNLNITLNEILPLIFEAADNCTPPLFEDQPQEKINIISKLGFGMHEEVSLENEGETKWYTPMSCEKIKIHLPQLCKENKDCAKINNPLSYYSRKKWIMSKNGELSSEASNDESNEASE
ncbi:DNA primase large subunit PriL [Methanobrevibacter sp.]|uniref:DNA primase large subunit PriL n=1 Tax=Methanobrevibacter sp. TaxID=66852 RepID=UPI0025E756C5|nr:DNA primase large subunit PriL [Methanobrevibacter sp.]MBQ2962294.1 DNA primase large subunit PriL [Methanobrevibacter sp.]